MAESALNAYGASVPLDDIAKAAGLGNATLYRYFPTRETDRGRLRPANPDAVHKRRGTGRSGRPRHGNPISRMSLSAAAYAVLAADERAAACRGVELPVLPARGTNLADMTVRP